MESITLDKLVDKMCNDKGITLNYEEYRTKDQVINYLLTKNNYLRTTSYRKIFQKHESGVNKGKYIRLDFKYLVESNMGFSRDNRLWGFYKML